MDIFTFLQLKERGKNIEKGVTKLKIDERDIEGYRIQINLKWLVLTLPHLEIFFSLL
jgi:hypothetical protein